MADSEIHSLTGDSTPADSDQFYAVDGTGAVDKKFAWGDLRLAGAIDVQRFTADGTWTKPAGAVQVYAILIGAGAGGASGYRNAEGTARYGGGGGQAGALVEAWLDPDDLDSTEAVTVGTGGAGGTAVTTLAIGNDGTAGGATILDTIAGELSTGTSLPGINTGGFTPGLGGASVGVGADNRGGTALVGLSDPTLLMQTTLNGYRGGGGSGISRNVANANIGGAGGGSNPSAPGAAAGNAVAGTDAPAGTGLVGGGGGGGGAVTNAGGAGGIPGGAGGGGAFGNSTTPNDSGAGGDGARGEAIIITFC